MDEQQTKEKLALAKAREHERMEGLRKQIQEMRAEEATNIRRQVQEAKHKELRRIHKIGSSLQSPPVALRIEKQEDRKNPRNRYSEKSEVRSFEESCFTTYSPNLSTKNKGNESMPTSGTNSVFGSSSSMRPQSSAYSASIPRPIMNDFGEPSSQNRTESSRKSRPFLLYEKPRYATPQETKFPYPESGELKEMKDLSSIDDYRHGPPGFQPPNFTRRSFNVLYEKVDHTYSNIGGISGAGAVDDTEKLKKSATISRPQYKEFGETSSQKSTSNSKRQQASLNYFSGEKDSSHLIRSQNPTREGFEKLCKDFAELRKTDNELDRDDDDFHVSHHYLV